ncbi:hypothetical protein HanRHA438_Chr14g0631261 [Helianthus annuus]|uniref:Uncharacterized protein n=1 Tax=Helianthus annuus TaxID=4232 RepID=A0A251SDP1_HELAN|nr:hypothetical protein HanXRQr2_Chr14g0621381 [Helianthus annuus]KAJ0838578.1 hypothetical protein HanPSC8_Chr14g0596521 [Helianthus annuus]KAJ0851817.1 hypothetical protein HanRHA438_Chr14g0631261 [Helianthus annuus]
MIFLFLSLYLQHINTDLSFRSGFNLSHIANHDLPFSLIFLSLSLSLTHKHRSLI